MVVQFDGGKVLFVSGSIAFAAACCCDEEVGCTACDGDVAPAHWEVAVAGVTDGIQCTGCSQFNGTHVLSEDSTCLWSVNAGSLSGIGCGFTLTISLGVTFISPNWAVTVTLRVNPTPSGGLASYQKLYASKPDCVNLSGEVISKVSSSEVKCFTYPATVSVTAV